MKMAREESKEERPHRDTQLGEASCRLCRITVPQFHLIAIAIRIIGNVYLANSLSLFEINLDFDAVLI